MLPLRAENPEQEKVLVSWKEIASFLDRAERTVRRWERDRGLPVHRVPGGERGGVYAYPSELATWLRGKSSELEADDLATSDQETTGSTESGTASEGNVDPQLGEPAGTKWQAMGNRAPPEASCNWDGGGACRSRNLRQFCAPIWQLESAAHACECRDRNGKLNPAGGYARFGRRKERWLSRKIYTSRVDLNGTREHPRA